MKKEAEEEKSGRTNWRAVENQTNQTEIALGDGSTRVARAAVSKLSWPRSPHLSQKIEPHIALCSSLVGFYIEGGTTTPAKNLLRSRDTCTSVGFPSEMDGQTNKIRSGSRMKCVCMANGGGRKRESQWLETDIFSNKNRERDTQQNRPLSDIIMSKRGKNRCGNTCRIANTLSYPFTNYIYRLSIFTYSGYGSGLLFWQQIIISLDVLKNMIWSIRKLSKIVSHVATRSFKPDCLHGDTEKCRRKC